MDYNILEKESETKGSFYIEENGDILAEMTYSKAGEERIIIDHTEVSEKLRGKGAGVQLVEYAVDFVRKKGIKLLPLCPFAKATLLRHPEWKDVW
ncbi:GNAT family N-acetyltransferase [Roseivirga misakiensis]|uniref:GNAT family N-acetyltransferase n=1 Tax=Roseivirga misakiensis TaxID=1563681 RepID=A0A1E5SZA4_9BACT|nr:GNAT family N-acetyltransferase [Roseivirga misakiensis]OEK04377.1 GNAT family N-acetyltransferase [Roseivirga misakiensis]